MRSLRSSNQNLLSVPRTLWKTCGDRAFESNAPKLWNALPTQLRFAVSVDCFKMQLRTHSTFSSRPMSRLPLSLLSFFLLCTSSYLMWFCVSSLSYILPCVLCSFTCNVTVSTLRVSEKRYTGTNTFCMLTCMTNHVPWAVTLKMYSVAHQGNIQTFDWVRIWINL